MTTQSRRPGLTLTELVVVLAVLTLGFVVGITWIARMRTHSWRMSCAANLSAIGKHMLMYTGDYDDPVPVAGGPSSRWTGRVADWTAPNRRQAYGLSQDDSGGQVSISASLYLLVKYPELPAKTLVCGERKWGTQERGVTEFRVDTYPVAKKNAELIDFWDFGPEPTRHVSYAYQMPYGAHKLDLGAGPRLVLAADRNPWVDSPAAKARDFSRFQPDLRPRKGTPEQARHGNTLRHEGKGQNVLFLDCHVEFKDRPTCSLDNDNIYTSWDAQDKTRGVPPKLGSEPADAKDSLLVNDPVTPVR